MRARIQQLESTKSVEARYLSTNTRIQGCLKKASTNTTRSKRRGLLPGTSKLTLVEGELHVVEGIGDLHVAVLGIGDLLVLGSNVDCSSRSSKTIKGENKAR